MSDKPPRNRLERREYERKHGRPHPLSKTSIVINEQVTLENVVQKVPYMACRSCGETMISGTQCRACGAWCR